MEGIKNIYDVTKRLLGMIEPSGDSSIDQVRYLNLEDTIDLTEHLIDDLILVARNKGHYASSIDKSGSRADKFITELREKLTAD
jgi:hypothetical protein